VELYKDVAALLRAFGAIANEMGEAGYSDQQTADIKAEVAHYAAVRDEVRRGAGEDIDFKQYEAGMRFLFFERVISCASSPKRRGGSTRRT
jgi:type I restriction enzyme, R subunit